MVRPRARWSLLLAALLSGGCLLAAGGAAAGGGIYYTTRGAEAVVHGDLDAVAGAVREAFGELGIDHRGHREADDGESREIFGDADGDDVTVQLVRRTENATLAEVRVKTSAVTWDKELAETILQEVRERRGR